MLLQQWLEPEELLLTKRIKINSPKNLGHFVNTYFPAQVPPNLELTDPREILNLVSLRGGTIPPLPPPPTHIHLHGAAYSWNMLWFPHSLPSYT
jgi:hypothetical protein